MAVGHYEVIEASTSCSPPVLQQLPPRHLWNVVTHPRLECFSMVHMLLQDPSFVVGLREAAWSRGVVLRNVCITPITQLAARRFLGLKL